jgi:uncharacterized protein (TIGR03437 family)
VAQVVGANSSNLILAISGGDNQIALPGASLPQALSVSLSDSDQIVYPGAHVTFAVVSGDASVSSPDVDTDVQGIASTQLQLGMASGPVSVRASVSGTPLSVDFSLSSLGAPQVSQQAIVNGASFAPVTGGMPSIAPGSIISIFGTNLAAKTAAAQSIPLQTALAGTSVTIGGVSAPLLYVSPFQINAQVPTDLITAFLNLFPIMSLTVRNPVGDGPSVNTLINSVDPGIFTVDASGRGAGAIRHNATGLAVDAQDPAVPGEFVQIFATGLGAVSPAVPSGQAASSQPPSSTTLAATVTMNGVNAPVSFSGLAPGFVGLYQVNAQVPQVAAGTAQVVLTINGVFSPPVTMAVGNQ